ncbi:MAG: DNA polymerase IV [Candidatus Cloacimonetes bacterium]|nr:DNA polymerase IV [Candidatus Cloacimonadota bacterium]
MSDQERKILHVDMDAFFASVEILDKPHLKDLPVIVGGNPKSRGVVCAANYIAREYGVHSAMPLSQALNLCPKAIFLPIRMNRYKEISNIVQDIFKSYSSNVQPLSLDEAWIDVTNNNHNIPSATWIAQAIKKDVFEATGLTCSIGVSYNKFLAKIASDYNKPNGIYVVPPNYAINFLSDLPIRKIPGVGKVTEKQLIRENLKTVGDIQKLSREELYLRFGRLGKSLYNRSRGVDHSEVKISSKSKSISVESTFSTNTNNIEDLRLVLKRLVSRLFQRTKQKQTIGKTLVLKIKFFDFEQITRSLSCNTSQLNEDQALEIFLNMIRQIVDQEYPNKLIRLVGIGFNNLSLKSHEPSSLIEFFSAKKSE